MNHLGQPLCQQPPGVGHRGGYPGSPQSCGPRLFGAHPCFAFGGGRTAQRIRAPAHRVGALLGGAHRQSGFHFDAAGGFGGCGDLLPGECGTRLRRTHLLGLLGVVQPAFEFGDLVEGGGATGFQLLALPTQRVPLFCGSARVLTQPAQLLIHRRDFGVGFIERGQSLFGGVLTGGLLGHRTGQRGAQLGHLRLRGGQFVAGLVDLGGDLQGAELAIRAAAHPAGAHQITVDGDGAQLRAHGHQIQRRGQVVDHGRARKHGDQRAAQPRGRLDQIERPQGPSGQYASRGGIGGGRPITQDQRRAASVGFLERGHRGPCRAEAFGGQRIGRRTKHRRQRRLIARPDLDQLGDRTEKSCARVILRKPSGAVLALQPDR